MNSWLAGTMVIVALLAWGGFALFASQIASDRADYAEALSTSEQESLRGDSAARLRATMESTVEERADLERILALNVLQAVEIVEQTMREAGARDVVTQDASAGSDIGDVSAVSLVVNATGSFAALSRAIALLETLPIPASLEGLELESVDGGSWRLTARLRILMAPPSL